MLTASLTPHPANTPRVVQAITVAVDINAQITRFTYRVHGAIAQIAWPSHSAGVRTDGLWHSTCVEAFIREPGQLCYREFNFSPSTAWAAYEFENYRLGMRALEITAPVITTECHASDFVLTAAVPTSALVSGASRSLQLGLTAVIEEQGAGLSYWALAHTETKPDFHAPRSFTLDALFPKNDH